MEICPCGHHRWDRHNWLGQCLDCNCGKEDKDDAWDKLLKRVDNSAILKNHERLAPYINAKRVAEDIADQTEIYT